MISRDRRRFARGHFIAHGECTVAELPGAPMPWRAGQESISVVSAADAVRFDDGHLWTRTAPDSKPAPDLGRILAGNLDCVVGCGAAFERAPFRDSIDRRA